MNINGSKTIIRLCGSLQISHHDILLDLSLGFKHEINTLTNENQHDTTHMKIIRVVSL